MILEVCWAGAGRRGVVDELVSLVTEATWEPLVKHGPMMIGLWQKPCRKTYPDDDFYKMSMKFR